MHVAIESPQPGMTVVRPQGPLDMHSVPAFHQILEAEVQQAERGLIVALTDMGVALKLTPPRFTGSVPQLP
jgi:hypothetical protein